MNAVKATEGKTSNSNGDWIPAEFRALDLDIIQINLLSKIYGLSKTSDCYASNHYFADFLKIGKDRAGQIIKILLKKGYIERQLIWDDSKKYIRKRYLRIKDKAWGGGSKLGEVGSTLPVPLECTTGGGVVHYEVNNITNNISNNKEADLENKKTIKKSKPNTEHKAILKHQSEILKSMVKDPLCKIIGNPYMKFNNISKSIVFEEEHKNSPAAWLYALYYLKNHWRIKDGTLFIQNFSLPGEQKMRELHEEAMQWLYSDYLLAKKLWHPDAGQIVYYDKHITFKDYIKKLEETIT